MTVRRASWAASPSGMEVLRGAFVVSIDFS
jgi:hypothetical protein